MASEPCLGAASRGLCVSPVSVLPSILGVRHLLVRSSVSQQSTAVSPGWDDPASGSLTRGQRRPELHVEISLFKAGLLCPWGLPLCRELEVAYSGNGPLGAADCERLASDPTLFSTKLG